MCKKNIIPISIGVCVIALQSYREILKKYRKRVITTNKKHFFQKIEKTVFRQSHEECSAKVSKLKDERCGYNCVKPHTHIRTRKKINRGD